MRTLLLLAVVLATILFLLSFVRLEKVVAVLTDWSFLPPLCVNLVVLLAMSAKWKLILKEARFKQVFLATLIGQLANNLTPMALGGGEVARAYSLSKLGGLPTSKVVASVVVDVFLEWFPLFVLLLGALLCALFVPLDLHILLVLVSSCFFFLGLTAIATLSLTSKRLPRAFEKLIGHFSKLLVTLSPKLGERFELWVAHYFERLETSLRSLMDAKRLFAATLLALGIWLLRVLRVSLVFDALGSPQSFERVLIGESIAILAAFLPISPAGIGVWEASRLTVFSLLGVELGTIAEVIILDRVITSLIPSLLGLFVLLAYELELSLRQGHRIKQLEEHNRT